jgi:ribosomal protein L16/L10AE
MNLESTIKVSKLTEEGYQMLKALHSSPQWKFYRDMLIRIKEAKHLALYPEDNPNRLLKGMGEVAGINFVINELDMLVMHHAKVEQQNIKETLEAAQKENK